MQLEKSWDNIKLRQFLEFIQLKPTDYELYNEFEIDLLCILLDISREEYDKLSMGEKFKLLLDLEFYMNNNPTSIDEFEIDGIKFFRYDFSFITIGEWISLDYYLKNDMKLEALTILWRRKQQKTKFDKPKYISNWSGSSEYFINCKCGIITIIDDYIKWKNNIENKYPDIFKSYDHSNVEEISDLTPREKRDIMIAQKVEKSALHWIWEDILLEMANNKYLKVEQASNLPVIYVFNMLNRRMDKDSKR